MPVLRRDGGALQDLLSEAQSANDPGRGRPAAAAAGPVRTYALSPARYADGREAFSLTLKKPGTYYRECTDQASMASMHAVVIVK